MLAVRLALVIVAIALRIDSAGGQVQGGARDSLPQYTLPGSRVHDFSSAINGRPYRLWVALPANYANRPSTRYPVLYLLDGGIAFPTAVTAYQVQNRGTDSLILVGVGYSDTRGLNYRLVDYGLPLAPSADSTLQRLARESRCCQAAATVRVLREEIFPLIDRTYRTADDRGLFGHSVGGNFAAYVLFAEPDLFRRYAITSPSPWSDNATLFDREATYAATHRDLAKTVFISVGSEEGAWNTYSAARLAATLRARQFPSLDLTDWTLDKASHGSMTEYSMGLRVLYPPRWGAYSPGDSVVTDAAMIPVRSVIDAYNRRDTQRIRSELANDSGFQASIRGRVVRGADEYLRAVRAEWRRAPVTLRIDSLRVSSDGPRNAVFIARSGPRRVMFDVVRRPEGWRIAYILHSEPDAKPVTLVVVEREGGPVAGAEVSVVGEEGVLATARTDSLGVARVAYDWRRSNGWYTGVQSPGSAPVRAGPPTGPRMTVLLQPKPDGKK